MSLDLLFFVAFLVSEILATITQVQAALPRINLMALGLVFFALTLIV